MFGKDVFDALFWLCLVYCYKGFLFYSFLAPFLLSVIRCGWVIFYFDCFVAFDCCYFESFTLFTFLLPNVFFCCCYKLLFPTIFPLAFKACITFSLSLPSISIPSNCYGSCSQYILPSFIMALGGIRVKFLLVLFSNPFSYNSLVYYRTVYII